MIKLKSKVSKCGFYLGGPGIFYKDGFKDHDQKQSEIKDLLAKLNIEAEFDDISNVDGKILRDPKLIAFGNQLVNGDTKVIPQDALDSFAQGIADGDRGSLLRAIQSTNLFIGLMQLDLYPEGGLSADTGTIYEFGFLEGMMATKTNIFVIGFYSKPVSTYGERLAGIYGGMRNATMHADGSGLRGNNDHLIDVYNQSDNLMFIRSESAKRFKMLEIGSNIVIGFENAKQKILELIQAYSRCAQEDLEILFGLNKPSAKRKR